MVLLQGIRSFYSSGMFMGIGRLLLLLEVKRRLMAPVLRMRDRQRLGGNIAGIFVTDKKMGYHPWVSKLLKAIPSRVQSKRSFSRGGSRGTTCAEVVSPERSGSFAPPSLECIAFDEPEDPKLALRASVDSALRREAAKRGVGYADPIKELAEPLFLHAVWRAAKFATSGRSEPTERDIGDSMPF